MVSKHSLALGLGTPSKSCAASFSRAALAGHRSRTVHCRRALLADSLLPQSLAREQPACRGRTLAEPIRGQKRIKKTRKTLFFFFFFFFEKNAERCRKYPRVSASFALISSPLEEKRAGRQQRKKQQKKNWRALPRAGRQVVHAQGGGGRPRARPCDKFARDIPCANLADGQVQNSVSKPQQAQGKGLR